MKKFDRLGLLGFAKRVERLEAEHVKRRGKVMDEYQEILDISWEEEFYPMMLRIREFVSKLPQDPRTAFIREIVMDAVSILSPVEMAGLFHSIAHDIFFAKSQVLMQRRAMPVFLLQGEEKPDSSKAVV